MPYIARTDLVARGWELELDQVAAGDESAVERACADASAEIDLYLGTRYAVPLAVLPEPLVRIACDLARYHLQSAGATEEVAKRYEAAVKVLTRISVGDIKLGALESAAATGTATGAAATSATRVMTRDGLAGVL